MAISIITRNSSIKLFDQIKDKFKNDEIDTWVMDSDGDFTHKPSQWFEMAWFRKVKISGNELIFGIVGRNGIKMSKVVYGIYHGRFTEMLLTYFDEEIENITISSLLKEGVDSTD